jgi:hypothetical protein
LLVLGGCGNRHKNYQWDKFPQERLNSYFPYIEEENIKFVSENNDTIKFLIKINRFTYMPLVVGKEEYKKECGEIAETIVLDNEEPDAANFRLLVGTTNRHTIIFNVVINLPNGWLLTSFQQYEEYDENYMPLDGNHIFTYLTDTITLCNSQRTDVAYLVTGKGLVSFVDKDGVEWRAVE